MDSINTQKLQSIRNYKKFQFLNTLFLHSVLALLCTLLCSCPFWFPLLCSSINSFFSFFFNPKFLFIVGNAIIIFLVGESKLSNSPSTPATEIYNEYVRKSRNGREFSSQMEKKEDGKLGMKLLTEESVKEIEEVAEESVKEIEKEAEKREEEEESGFETEELNKRVEDFIARVNRQRLIEARFEDCGR